MRVCAVVVLLLVLLFGALFLAGGVDAQGGVPENGSFAGNRNAWALTSPYSYDCSYSASEGYAAPGALVFYYACWAYSLPVHLSSGSSLSFAAKSDSPSTVLDIDVVCAHPSSALFSDVLLGTSWTVYALNLAGLAGQDCYFRFHAYGGGYLVVLDDVVVSNASNWLLGTADVNGKFLGDGWAWYDSLTNCSLWVAGYGHDDLGSIRFWDTWCKLDSFPFFASTPWSAYYRHSYDGGGAGNIAFRVLDFDGAQGEQSILVVDPVVDSNWASVSLDLSSFGSHRVMWRVQAGYSMIDDVCPSSCLVGTPTPLPTSTPLPLPTSTSLPSPTSGGGGGSGINCPSSSPCYVIVQNTPLPVSIQQNGTPLVVSLGGTPIKIDDSTPVSIRYNTPQVTAVSMSSAAQAVSLGGAQTYYDSGGISGVIPTSGGSSGDPVAVRVDSQSISFCLPAQVQAIFSGVGCLSGDVLSVGQFRIGSVDLLPYFAVVTVFVMVIFVIRQLQEK